MRARTARREGEDAVSRDEGNIGASLRAAGRCRRRGVETRAATAPARAERGAGRATSSWRRPCRRKALSREDDFFRASARSGGGNTRFRARDGRRSEARREAAPVRSFGGDAERRFAEGTSPPSPPPPIDRRRGGVRAGRAGRRRVVGGFVVWGNRQSPDRRRERLEIGPRLGHRERAGDVAERLKALVC